MTCDNVILYLSLFNVSNKVESILSMHMQNHVWEGNWFYPKVYFLHLYSLIHDSARVFIHWFISVIQPFHY